MSAAGPGPAGECPQRKRVVHYGVAYDARCNNRACPSCGVLWLGDTRIRTLAGCQGLTRAVALVTVTAPGRDVLPWDETGKRVDAYEARRWNEAAPSRWSSLHATAAAAARRRASRDGDGWYLICRVWEYQKRGVLHLHLLVPCGTLAERAASEAYVAALALHARSEGFGFVDRGRLPERGPRTSARRLDAVPPHRAAAYVASYVASSGAGKEGVAEVARRQGVPGPIVYLSHRLSRRSGVTMRSLRGRRKLIAQYPDCQLSPDHWRAAAVADGLRRSRAPFTEGERVGLAQQALGGGWCAGFDVATGEYLPPTDAAPPPPSWPLLRCAEGRAGSLVSDLTPYLTTMVTGATTGLS